MTEPASAFASSRATPASLRGAASSCSAKPDMVRRRPSLVNGRDSRSRLALGRKQNHESTRFAGSLDTTCPRHSETLPVMIRRPVSVCCHSSTTCETSLAVTNFSSTRVLVVPTTWRLPGSITEKISLISTDLPPPFSRNSTLAGDGRRGRPCSAEWMPALNSASCVGALTIAPTPDKSSSTSWYRAPAGPTECRRTRDNSYIYPLESVRNGRPESASAIADGEGAQRQQLFESAVRGELAHLHLVARRGPVGAPLLGVDLDQKALVGKETQCP